MSVFGFGLLCLYTGLVVATVSRRDPAMLLAVGLLLMLIGLLR